MNPDIHGRIKASVQHTKLYQNDKYEVSMFTKNIKSKNELNTEIQYVLDMLNIQIQNHRYDY